MRLKFLLSFFAVVLLVLSCFLPWMTIESKGITITGLDTEPTKFGKPAYFHFIWAALYLGSLMVDKIWAKRTVVALAAFNIAWALRNFLLIPACAGGECPVKKEGLYILLIASLAMFITPLLSEKLSAEKEE